MEVISRDGTTAQIDPLRFCRWMLERCKEKGVQMHHPARALSVSQEQGVLNGIRISQDGVETECKTIWILIGFSPAHTLQYRVHVL
jgi:flavin-dependent dehydrogenase